MGMPPVSEDDYRDVADPGSALLDPVPPGEILLEDFLKPLGISQNRLAREIDVPVSRIAGIISGSRAVTADTALRLGAFFGVSPQLWLGLQTDYDLQIAHQRDWPRIRDSIRRHDAA